MRILLLETDNILAANLVAMMTLAGHEVEWQVDPQEAVLAMDDKPVDVVVMDLILAGRSGVEFLYELRSYDDWANLPVILLSSVPPREIYTCVASLEQLQVRTYHYKPTTTLSDMVASVEACRQPALPANV
jgi:DNA-binding response OmpR family regulator